MNSDVITVIIALVILIGILVWCVKALIMTTRKIRNGFREVMGKNPAEIDKAFDILNSCYKNGLVPSWAVQEALKTLKKYYTPEAAMEGITEMLKQNNVKYLELPAEYKVLPPATYEQLKEVCYSHFRKFNMEYFTRNGEPNKRDMKVMEYLFRMWYFADDEVETFEEAVDRTGDVFVKFCGENAANSMK